MKAIFVLLLLPLHLFSQDLSGIWVGTIATSQVQMPFELAINQDMTGYSMITFMYKGAEKIAVKKINLNRKDSVFTISDDKLIYNNFATKSRSIKTFCELSLTMVDSHMVLSGPFHTRTRDLRAGDDDLASGTITLQKQNNQAQTRLIHKLDTLKLSNTLAFSNPTPAFAASEKESSVVAESGKKAAAVVENPVKDLAAVKAKQEPNSENGKNKETAVVAASEKEASVVAESGKKAPAVVENPVKDLAAVKAKQEPNSENGKNKETAVVAASEKEASVVAESGKKAPAVVENPVKDLAAVKVKQQVNSENGKNKETAAVAASEQEAPAPSEKNLSAVKVQQQVSSEKGKNTIHTVPKIIAAAADLSLRATEVIRTIDFKSDSLTLILYDNGIVDGDTVSVILNGEVIIPKQGISEQAYRKVIKIPPGSGDSLQLVLYAENLGSIPPNSGLLIIEDGSDRYEVRFKGDMKNSSAVRLRRKQ